MAAKKRKRLSRGGLRRGTTYRTARRYSGHVLFVSMLARAAIERQPAAYSKILLDVAREARQVRMRHGTDVGVWKVMVAAPDGVLWVASDFNERETFVWFRAEINPAFTRL